MKSLFDPLRLQALFNILADVCLILSGADFGNPVRSLSAALGLGVNALIGLLGSGRRVLTFQATDIVMGTYILCGLLYILSGSNILGFEDAPRYSEMIGGFGVMTAAGLILCDKSKIASYVFLIATQTWFTSSLEAWIIQGNFDIFTFLAFVFFNAAAISSRYIKRQGKVEGGTL